MPIFFSERREKLALIGSELADSRGKIEMSGHIRRRGEQSWELKFDIGADPLTGKLATKYRAFKGTKKEAQAELVRLINSAHQGDFVDPSKTTLSEFLDRWLRDWAAVSVGPTSARCRFRNYRPCIWLSFTQGCSAKEASSAA